MLVLDEPVAHLDRGESDGGRPLRRRERSVLLINHRPKGLGLVDDGVVLP